MKKNGKALLLSLGILTVIGGILLLWVFGLPGQKESAKTQEHKVVETKKAEGKKDTDSGKKEIAVPDQPEVKQPEPEQEPQKPVPEEVTLAITGDILLSSHVLNNYDSGGINDVVSDRLRAEMQSADITMANEEFPFSERGSEAQDKQFTFRVNPSYVAALTELGVDVVTVANNHALDFGKEALTDTFTTLDGAGIAYVGAGDSKERAMQPFITEAGGRKIGFLAASRVIPEVSWNIENQQPGMLCTYDSELLCEAVRNAKTQCDYVVVYVHWGVERENTPQEYQRQLAKSYIDAGADLVIGAHPHVLQGMEYYQGKPIVYSLGNFIFNQEIKSTVLLKVSITEDNHTSLQLIPAFAAGAKTQEMDEATAAELYQFMEGISFGVTVDADGRATESPQ